MHCGIAKRKNRCIAHPFCDPTMHKICDILLFAIYLIVCPCAHLLLTAIKQYYGLFYSKWGMFIFMLNKSFFFFFGQNFGWCSWSEFVFAFGKDSFPPSSWVVSICCTVVRFCVLDVSISTKTSTYEIKKGC